MNGSLRTEAALKQVLRFEEVEGISLLGFVAGGAGWFCACSSC
jgi:hypothetical protein